MTSFTLPHNPDAAMDLSAHKDVCRDSANLIRIDHVGVKYRAFEALQDISFVAHPGRLIGIIGPNGAGKSTLLQAMLGLTPLATGTVSYDGKPLTDQLERIAYVPQRSQLDLTYPATVWDVVMLGRVKKTGWFRRFSAYSRQVAAAALERVGMTEYRDRPIGQLSGGQQQRVFLARAIAQEADVVCFDEPFVGIDQKTEAIIFEIFHELTRSGKTLLVINHDLGESIAHFDDLVLLNKTLIASGDRRSVLTSEHLSEAYGGKVMFFQ